MTQPPQWLVRIFGRPGLVLSGETAVKRRQELVRTFEEDERVPFFVLSLKAGGTGLNLARAAMYAAREAYKLTAERGTGDRGSRARRC